MFCTVHRISFLKFSTELQFLSLNNVNIIFLDLILVFLSRRVFTREAVLVSVIAPLQLCGGFSPGATPPLMNTYASAVHLMSGRLPAAALMEIFSRGETQLLPGS